MNRLAVVSMSLMLTATTMLMAESETDYRCGQGPYSGYGMMGQGYGYGMHGQGMMGQGYGMHGQGMMGQGYNNQRDYEPIPEVKAKKMLNQYIKDNLKGFKLVKLDKQRMPMGILYLATVEDNNGNVFELHLNPWGYIKGPFVH